MLAPVANLKAETYLTLPQAQQLMLGTVELTPHLIRLTESQISAIEEASGVRVRYNEISAWRSAEGDWFVLDHVIGKHENIDIAVTFDSEGKVKGIEVLTYRESYGDEIRHPKWRAQFYGKDHTEHLKLDHQIKNIAGATLSCRHVTDAINRLNHTWRMVLQHRQ
jgi:Na+-translocating ferredoxin:NAD+ oxidoreductase RnfG subunit